MMDIFAVAAVTLCAVVIAALLKRTNAEYTLLIAVVTVIFVLMSVLERVIPLVEEVRAVAEIGLFAEPYLEVLLKAVGITILAQITREICKDSGQAALAYSVDLAARVTILMLCLPIISSIFGYIQEILA